MNRYTQHGFTLIELLVVLAIISLLSSIVLSSLDQARESARDARREQDFRQISRALEAYYNDHGYYPKTNDRHNYIDDQSRTPAPELTNGDYMSEFPVDPQYGGDGAEDWGWDYNYRTFDDGQGYLLRTAFETKLERTHNYPNGSSCYNSQYPTCNWSGRQRCVYVAGSNCELYWLQHNSG